MSALRSWPLLGHAVSFARDPIRFVETARPLGDVVPIRLGRTKAFLVYTPQLCREVLVDAAHHYTRGVQADTFRTYMGAGLVTTDGEVHRRNRRLVQPAFHHRRIAGYVDAMRTATRQMTDTWRDGATIAADRELHTTAMRILGATLFGTASGEPARRSGGTFGSHAVDEVVRSVPVVLSGIGRRVLDPIGIVDRLPTRERRDFHTALTRLRRVVADLLAAYRADGIDHGDVLSMLLLARDEETDEGLSDQQIADEILALLTAGIDTTANTLAWALHYLGQHPQVQAQLLAEVDTVVGDRDVTVADVPQLKLVRRVVTECLRLYPPLWLITRRAATPTTLGGVDIPVGASVFVSLYNLHRDPDRYPEPDRFDPDRWLVETTEPRPSFVPFGLGRRVCLGEAFAWTETAVVLATISQHWRLQPAPGRPVKLDLTGLLRPNHLPMISTQRPGTP